MGSQSPTQFLGLSGSTPVISPSYSGTPGPGPAPNPWKVDGSTIFYDEGGALLPKAVTGGTQGKGTINAQGVFENGQRISQGSGPPSGPAGGDLEGSFYPDPLIKPDVDLPGNPTTTTPAADTDDDTIPTTQWTNAQIAAAIAALPPVSVQQNGIAFGGIGGALTSDVTNLFWNGTTHFLTVTGGVSSPNLSLAPTPGAPTEGGEIDWSSGSDPVCTHNLTEDMINNSQRAFSIRKSDSAVTLLWTLALNGAGMDFTSPVRAMSATAMPAGGTLGAGVMMSSTPNFGLMFGLGAPDKAAPRGTVQLRGDGAGTPYYNSDGTAAGWLPIGAGGATVSLTPPASPAPGALWFYSENIANGGTLFIWYDDGNTQQWVIAVPGPPAAVIPPGTIMDFAGVATPSGWLACIGQTVSRTGVNAALFAAIGTLYGAGDGSTTFGIPDLRGRTTAGLDPGGTASRLTTAISGVDGASVGAAGGDQRQQTHTHAMTYDHSHNITMGGGGYTGGYTGRAAHGDGNNAGVFGGVLSGVTAATSAANTGAGASQNVPPVMIMNKIIKL